MVKNTKNTLISIQVLSCIHCLFSGVMKELSFSPFDEHEIDYGGGGHTSEQCNAVFYLFRVVEREDDTGQPLDEHTEKEGDCHGYEYRHDDGKGFVGVYQVAQPEGVAVTDFDEGEGEGSSQQLERRGIRWWR